eukprot:TRINITY_DN14249_c0_g2_i2.p1 TRINITY_DN14249_c0_g2~~TRINITY_DN14249_c0_g2_i2.p1  ORF type:complete len:483 (+),score=50.16 TRINITY_DN14249_c0_g2_i2:24-1472(+)
MGAAIAHLCPFCVKRTIVKKLILPQSYPQLYEVSDDAKLMYGIVSIYDVMKRAVALEGSRASAVDALFSGSLLSPEIAGMVQRERKFAENADDFMDHLLVQPAQISKLALGKVADHERRIGSAQRVVNEQGVGPEAQSEYDGVAPSSPADGRTTTNGAEEAHLKHVFGTHQTMELLLFGTPTVTLTDAVKQRVDFAQRLNQVSSFGLDDFLTRLPAGLKISVAIITRHAYLIPFTTCDEVLIAPLCRGGAQPSVVDVPAPVFFRTGVFSLDQEIVAPALHSELLFEFEFDDSQQPTHVKWLMQMSSNGATKCEFLPVGTSRQAPFVGTKRRLVASGSDSVAMLKVCMELGPAMRAFAKDSGWSFDGFWRFGVCNDSVELAVRASLGRSVGVWPLLNNTDALRGFAAAVDDVFKESALERCQIQRLKEALQSMPSDAQKETDRTVAARILESWPWTPGQEPFCSSTNAYLALQEVANAHKDQE